MINTASKDSRWMNVYSRDKECWQAFHMREQISYCISLHPHYSPVSLSMLSLKDVSTKYVSYKELFWRRPSFLFLTELSYFGIAVGHSAEISNATLQMSFGTKLQCRHLGLTGMPKVKPSFRAQPDILNKLYKMFWKHWNVMTKMIETFINVLNCLRTALMQTL